MNDLARRAVACKGWRWMAGMRVGTEIEGSVILPDGFEKLKQAAILAHCAPILTDPATIGCILALAREAWKAPALQVSPARVADGSVREWFCYVNTSDNKYADPYFMGATEAEALVAALEAAP